MKKSTKTQAQIVEISAKIEILKARIATLTKTQQALSDPRFAGSKKHLLAYVDNSEKLHMAKAELDVLSQQLRASETAEPEAAVMEAEVASEGRAAAKKPLKKTDKRKSPAFIAHLRALAEARRKKPVDQPKAKPAKAKVVATKKPVVKGKVVAKKSA